MPYKKPEVVSLGEASILILGGKTGAFGENGNLIKRAVLPDAHLDD